MAKDIKMKDLIKENFGTRAFSTVGGLVTLKPSNTTSVPTMSELVEGEWFGEDKKKVDAGAFVQEVKNFSKLGEMIYREGSLRDVAKGLSELAEKARIATLQETDDWFDKVTINKIEPEDDFEDRDDKDIDNDGDTDDSDRYLHKRRKAVAKAIASKKK